MITKDQWLWMPHAGHFICGRDCQFHLNTRVGNYIVSTVGDYWPDSRVRQITARVRGIVIKGRGDEWDADYMEKIGFEDIGCQRKFETMVFRAKPEKGSCCPYRMVSGELDFQGYNDAKEAADGHMAMCEKWAGMQ